MAWTPEKNILLRNLFYERLYVEDSQSWYLWKASRSWTQIFNNNVTNTQKQLMLNDLIDDKVLYMNNTITATQTSSTQLVGARDALLTNKE